MDRRPSPPRPARGLQGPLRPFSGRLKPVTDDEIAELRRVAENPLVRPSERVEARRRLVEAGVVPQGRIRPKDKPYALAVAREMVREMGFD